MRVQKRLINIGTHVVSLICAALLAIGCMPLIGHADTPAAPSDGPSIALTAAQQGDSSSEIIIVYEQGSSDRASEASKTTDYYTEIEQLSAETPDAGSAVVAKVSQDSSVQEAIASAEEQPGVAYAQPNFKYYLMDVNDPSVNMQWYLGSWDNAMKGTNLLDAWNMVRSDNHVTVAVLDSGTMLDHEDLRDNILHELAVDITKSSQPGTLVSEAVPSGDNLGHGTRVAGLVSATANNAKGIAGSSYNANILPIKIIGDNSDTITCADLVKAYEYLFDLITEGKLNDLHVINLSLGGYDLSDTDRLLESKIEQAKDDYQILTVAAGGNGDDMQTAKTSRIIPGDFDACMEVTALDASGNNAKWSDYNRAKDISAPGVDIFSTFNENTSSYGAASGTSLATPIVSGIAALLWVADPDITVDEAKRAIYNTATPLNPSGDNYHRESGSHGAINASAAVKYVFDNYGGANRTSIAGALVDPIPDQQYTGTTMAPLPRVTYRGVELVRGKDYRVSCRNNIYSGFATMTIAGMGDYTGYKIAKFKISGPASRFTDVGLGVGESPHWVAKSGCLDRACSQHLIEGYSNENGEFSGLFGPEDPLTRGQVATVLYRHASSVDPSIANQSTENTSPFTDNLSGQYYTPAINWAAESHIMCGYGGTTEMPGSTVGPDNPVTREELAAMLAQYARYQDVDTTYDGTVSFDSAPDAGSVSDWARDSIGWCFTNGIMSGYAETHELAPQGGATRAEFCKMIVLTVDLLP